MDTIAGFEIRRGEDSGGYWYVCTSDGGYDATGETIEIALSRLIVVLHEVVLENTRIMSGK